MLDLKNKEINKKMKLIVTVLFAMFIICNGILSIKNVIGEDSIKGLVIGLLPLCLGTIGSGIIFCIFKKKNGLKFILGTIFSVIMYYIFWYLGIVIILSIAVIITAFE